MNSESLSVHHLIWFIVNLSIAISLLIPSLIFIYVFIKDYLKYGNKPEPVAVTVMFTSILSFAFFMTSADQLSKYYRASIDPVGYEQYYQKRHLRMENNEND